MQWRMQFVSHTCYEKRTILSPSLPNHVSKIILLRATASLLSCPHSHYTTGTAAGVAGPAPAAAVADPGVVGELSLKLLDDEWEGLGASPPALGDNALVKLDPTNARLPAVLHDYCVLLL